MNIWLKELSINDGEDYLKVLMELSRYPDTFARPVPVNFEKPGGHLGCCLLKEYQNKGIGTIVADELSKIAYDKLGIEEVIYTSKDENIQSQRSLEKIGANLVDAHDGYHYYTVNLKEKYQERGGR